MDKIKQLIVFAVGVFVVLSTSAAIGSRNETIEKEIFKTSMYQDVVDQFQEDQSEDYIIPVGAIHIPAEPPMDINFQIAQSFIPTKGILTRAEIYVGRNSTASLPFTLAIREELTDENLVETSLDYDQFEVENISWLEFDFDDISVNVGETYYLVCYTENVTDNWYAWAGNNISESYEFGCAWASIDDGNTWTNESQSYENKIIKKQYGVAPLGEDDNHSDMCFRTYGIDGTELEIEITKTGLNFGAIIRNIGNFTAFDVEWDVSVQGGFFGFVNKTFSDMVPELAVDDTIEVPIGFFLGLGPVTIEVNARAENVPEVSESKDGFLILIFFIET